MAERKNMNRLIVLTGSSATGKSTVSTLLGRQLGIPVVHVSDLMRDVATSKGYSRLSTFFDKEGVENAFKQSRPLIQEHINRSIVHSNVILEGLYDYGLFETLINQFGRKNIFVVNFAANRSFRKGMVRKREQDKVKAKEELRRRDVVKWQVGLKDILSHADVKVRNNNLLPKVVGQLFRRIKP